MALARDDLVLRQSIAGLIILTGIAVALAPGNHAHLEKKHLFSGTIFGVLAAIGQGGGAVLSLKAFQLADPRWPKHRLRHGGVFNAFWRYRCRGRFTSSGCAARQADGDQSVEWRKAWPWVMVNTLGCPVLGVACYQWALATTRAASCCHRRHVALAVIPFAWRSRATAPAYDPLSAASSQSPV